MKKYLMIITVLLAMLISACSNQSQTKAWLTKGTRIDLPQPNLQQPYHDQQLLKFNYNGQENSLITLIDIDQNQLKVIGLSALGIRLFEINYNGNTINTKHNIFVKELPAPEQVLSDIMLSILPIKNWQAVLPTGWQLIDNEKKRLLLNDKQETIVEISYTEKPSEQIRKPNRIKHHIFSYEITIQRMDKK
ncbi:MULTISPECIES: DUF3261 domain-containing protein [unclassified Gilliamella]|uniref:DUF3261 domain-containing protein n=1 Tax=unclassified Gilliamella TaxID=2685620 RepID=UPI001325E5DB|nr:MULTISPECIES: DUF3261 domain-containing protein [unclassified Gilliamella]MWN31385.1 DUF3261 domain-containing protein [Gilliamella sp. Pra-s60]MWP29007.1 DUF3261 domain-containing protein [Gilliamella sp. Pra-s54]